MYSTLRVYFGKQKNFYLDFDLKPSPITDLWLERMHQRDKWPLDHPDRFYGFNSRDQEINQSLIKINQCIDIINSHYPIINRRLDAVDDQDTLNYLHNIFEIYHGQLDQQDHQFWKTSPEEVHRALADLNIAVHRCESAGRFMHPRFVCTWWGMPKEKRLPVELIKQYGTTGVEFGGVYLNYVEIGKTMLELAVDNDLYAASEMFKPFDFYSADFVVYFYTSSTDELEKNESDIKRYFEQRRDFFNSLGIKNANDHRAKQLKFKVAQLQYEDKSYIINKIKNNQYIFSIELI